MKKNALYIHRECESWLDVMTKLNPALSIMGPRQAGKTELITQYFPNLPSRFVITGSHNYLLAGAVKETMVGRAAIIELPPMTGSGLGIFDTAELMFKEGVSDFIY